MVTTEVITTPTAPVDTTFAAEQVRSTLLPYFVQRTPSNLLPVYKETKRGGNLRLTKVRKISGDVKRLHNDLKAYLDLSEAEITINSVTQNIIAKVRCGIPIAEYNANLMEKRAITETRLSNFWSQRTFKF